MVLVGDEGVEELQRGLGRVAHRQVDGLVPQPGVGDRDPRRRAGLGGPAPTAQATQSAQQAGQAEPHQESECGEGGVLLQPVAHDVDEEPRLLDLHRHGQLGDVLAVGQDPLGLGRLRFLLPARTVGQRDPVAVRGPHLGPARSGVAVHDVGTVGVRCALEVAVAHAHVRTGPADEQGLGGGEFVRRGRRALEDLHHALGADGDRVRRVPFLCHVEERLPGVTHAGAEL